MAVKPRSKAGKGEAEQFDIIVVGGGMVGVTMVRALAHLPLRIAFIEAVSYRADTQPSFDDRVIALSQGSARILNNLNLFAEIARHSCPIRHIHVSDKGRCAFARLHAEDYDVDALGYVSSAKLLGASLIKDLSQQQNLSIFQPATLTQITEQDHGYSLEIALGDSAQQLYCGLLIAADGDHSTVRGKVGIAVNRVDYKQSAIVANVSCEFDHANVAYERFTAQGPLALLPMREKTMGVVWTHARKNVEQTMALDDQQFCRQLQQQFGARLGEIRAVSKRHAYSLGLAYPESPVAKRLVLIGNAAHTLHPVAGQGFNLGMRDLAMLAQLIEQALHNGQDIGSEALLQQYAAQRKADHKTIIRFTHGLVLGFSNALAPFKLARGVGLLATDLIPMFKRRLAMTSMGLSTPLARLSMLHDA